MPQALVVFAVLTALSLTACSYSGEPQQTSVTNSLRLSDGDRAVQTFVPRGEPLGRIDVLVGTYEVTAPDGVLTATIRGDGEERLVRVDGADIADIAWLALRFPPVHDAAGEPFEVALAWEGNDDLALFTNPADPYPDGELTSEAEAGSGDVQGDLAFRVGHTGRLRGGLAALARVPGEFASRLGDDPAFTAVWAVVLATLLGLLGWSSARRRRS